jgi:hypothetical protein
MGRSRVGRPTPRQELLDLMLSYGRTSRLYGCSGRSRSDSAGRADNGRDLVFPVKKGHSDIRWNGVWLRTYRANTGPGVTAKTSNRLAWLGYSGIRTDHLNPARRDQARHRTQRTLHVQAWRCRRYTLPPKTHTFPCPHSQHVAIGD